MNKSELVEAIAQKTNMEKSATERMLDATLETISETLSKGNDVKLKDFGSFDVKATKEREGRNPKTGETIKIAAAKKPRFKAAKALKQMVN